MVQQTRMPTDNKHPQIMELFSKNFPEILDEYERCVAERRENFNTDSTTTLTLFSIIAYIVLWFYTFYRLSIHAHELPGWFLVLGFFTLFLVPGGFMLVLIVLHLLLNRQRTAVGQSAYAKSRAQGFPSRSLYSRYSRL
jgi:hypothetical protein